MGGTSEFDAQRVPLEDSTKPKMEATPRARSSSPRGKIPAKSACVSELRHLKRGHQHITHRPPRRDQQLVTPVFSVGGPNPKRLASWIGVEALQRRAGGDLARRSRHDAFNMVASPPVRYLAIRGRVLEAVEQADSLIGPLRRRAFRREEEEVIGIP